MKTIGPKIAGLQVGYHKSVPVMTDPEVSIVRAPPTKSYRISPLDFSILQKKGFVADTFMILNMFCSAR